MWLGLESFTHCNISIHISKQEYVTNTVGYKEESFYASMSLHHNYHKVEQEVAFRPIAHESANPKLEAALA